MSQIYYILSYIAIVGILVLFFVNIYHILRMKSKRDIVVSPIPFDVRLEVYKNVKKNIFDALLSYNKKFINIFICPELYNEFNFINHISFIKDGIRINPTGILQIDFPEFAKTKLKGKKYGRVWFGDGISGLERRYKVMSKIVLKMEVEQCIRKSFEDCANFNQILIDINI